MTLRFNVLCAQNFAHAHANFARARTNFVRAHVQNHEICARAQIGLARGRCSNTLVFLLDNIKYNNIKMTLLTLQNVIHALPRAPNYN